MTVLRTERLTKRFGKLIAVDDLDFTVEEHEVTAVIGPNGAGKSTLFNLISGLMKPTEGQVYFNDEDITDLSPTAVSRRGIGRSFQIVDIFEGLTVRENVRVAVQSDRGVDTAFWGHVDADQATNREVETVLEEIGLGEYADSRADALSHGDRRKLDIALTFAIDPQLVLLDEPTAGMGKQESSETIRLIRDLSDSRGITLVLIEHDIEMVLEVADKIMVMHKGGELAVGTPDEIRNHEAVQEAYMGREVA